LRHNYGWIFFIQVTSYIGKLLIHPTPIGSLKEFFARATIGPVSEQLVLLARLVFHATWVTLAMMTYRSRRGADRARPPRPARDTLLELARGGLTDRPAGRLSLLPPAPAIAQGCPHPNLRPILAHPRGRRNARLNPPLASAGGHMRIVQILAFGVFAALVVACGAWALAWFGTSPGPPSAIQAASEPKSPKSTVVLEVAPERQSSGEIPAAPERKSVSATIHLNSNPQGADATASLGSRCRTPCSIELSADGPFTVTFTRKGFVPSTIPVQIEPAQPGVLDAKFTPDPIFAALQPLPAPEAKINPARSAARLAASPRDDHEATPSDGLLSRSWKYLTRKGRIGRRNSAA